MSPLPCCAVVALLFGLAAVCTDAQRPGYWRYPPPSANVIPNYVPPGFRPLVRPTCPPLPCPLLRCPFGVVFNARGCPTCVCKPAPVPRCPPLNCGPGCKVIPGLNGCPACDCFKGPGTPNRPRGSSDNDN